MRVGYDARMAIGDYRGMGKFLRMLIRGRENDLIGFCARGEWDSALKLIAKGPGFYPVWEQLWVSRLAAQHRLAAFIAPYNTAPLFLPRTLKLVLVVHDLIFLEQLPSSRSAYQNLGRAYRRFIVPRAIARANVLITVSQYTKDQLTRQFAKRPETIWVIPNCVEEQWFENGTDRCPNHRYLLIVGGEAPSKNLNRAIEAFARFRSLSGDSVRRLKIAGVKPAFHEAFMQHARICGVANAVDMLGYVSEEHMLDLYRKAELFVMPSLMEGFGIPVLEAMASGVPVICSSKSSLPEIGGNAARYFDPTSAHEMAIQMNAVLSDSSLRNQMVQFGLQQAQLYHPAVVRRLVDQFWSSRLAGWEEHQEPENGER